MCNAGLYYGQWYVGQKVVFKNPDGKYIEETISSIKTESMYPIETSLGHSFTEDGRYLKGCSVRLFPKESCGCCKKEEEDLYVVMVNNPLRSGRPKPLDACKDEAKEYAKLNPSEDVFLCKLQKVSVFKSETCISETKLK